MSRATAVVRFPDGELRVAVYDCCRDLVRSPLYTVGEWEAWWRERDDWPPMDDQNFAVAALADVEITVNDVFGSGTTWRGAAAKERVGIFYREPPDDATDERACWWPFPWEYC